MEGKEIIQEEVLGNIIITPDSKGNIEIKQHWGQYQKEVVIISPNKAREAALEICPELNSDLEKATELLKESNRILERYREVCTYFGDKKTSKEIVKQLNKSTTFLENSGLNKNLK